ncbi:MAG: sigma-54-dependent Fis family transcriptional regulator [Lewinellaceae bacterium]|nr:sigma-54-dependent Fis family transcriptional regulator [Lewinellaceae bacterium]
MDRPRILIIDDEKDIRGLLERLFRLEGYEVFQAENGAKGLKLLEKEEVHVVICDVKLPDAHGVELLPKIKAIQPLAEVILLTAYGTIPDGVQAIKDGAFDYITKGDDNNKIIPLVSRATEKAQLQYRVRELEAKVGGRHTFGEIVGRSQQFQRAIEMARKVAPTDATVLLNGETGTGKEVFAQAIHFESPRKNQPFVAVNCSALGKDLLESEMFGHKAGSFTGATKDKIGLFEEADKGTIFLDEIGEMDLALQAKLLRVLETGAFLKVGDTKEKHVDVRIIAATNRDLEKESETGRFRLDLYYRLSVFQLHLPSLQERREDIPLLARFFIQGATSRMNRKPMELSPEFEKALQQHHWKGNIRELKNIIERAVILTDGAVLQPDVLPFDFLEDEPASGQAPLSLNAVEERHIRKMLAYTQGNKTRTAEILGIGLTTLYRKMEEYGIDK